MRAILTATLLAAIALASVATFADAKADAKNHFDAGLILMNAEDYAAAAIEFEESIRFFKTKSAVFNLANCYRALKRYDEALVTLKALEREFGDKLDDEMREAVETIRKEIKTMTASLKVAVDAAGASIFVDGSLIGTSPMSSTIILGPGFHEVRAELTGEVTPTETVKLVAGEKKRVELRFSSAPVPAPVPAPAAPAVPTAEPAATPDAAAEEGTEDTAPAPPAQDGAPASGRREKTFEKWGHGLLWSGVALLVVGGVSTALAAQHGARVADTDQYNYEEEKKLSRLWSGFMWTGYGAGLALAAASIPLFVAAKRERSSPAVSFVPMFDGQSAALVARGEW